MGAPDVSQSLGTMSKFLEGIKNQKNQSGKKIFTAVLNAMLDLRKRLPPIYNFQPSHLLVDKDTQDVKIIVSQSLFKKDSNIVDLERDDMHYMSPEELHGKGKSLTTPFWVLGCLLYEARFNMYPFATHLKAQVTEMFIKFYPVMFPEDEENNDEDFKDLILHLLIKEPLQRLGSDTFEQELLDHPYFKNQD